MRALLDINVLIALFDRDHANHVVAEKWLERNIKKGWASCPITQNGCARIMSQPRYPNPLPLPEILARLAVATATPHHEFIADTVSVLDGDMFDQSRMLSPTQLTDAYLLGLAVANR